MRGLMKSGLRGWNRDTVVCKGWKIPFCYLRKGGAACDCGMMKFGHLYKVCDTSLSFSLTV